MPLGRKLPPRHGLIKTPCILEMVNKRRNTMHLKRHPTMHSRNGTLKRRLIKHIYKRLNIPKEPQRLKEMNLD